MNGLDTIIRDNSLAHARAYVAARQRGQWDRAADILEAAESWFQGEDWRRFQWFVIEAVDERTFTRGL